MLKKCMLCFLFYSKTAGIAGIGVKFIKLYLIFIILIIYENIDATCDFNHPVVIIDYNY